MFGFFSRKQNFIDKCYGLRFLDTKIESEIDLLCAPKVIYCFWTGKNDLSENRKKSLEILEKYSGVDVKLITPLNLKDYVIEDFPLHPAYEYLSLVHRSDYLRCYFMYHHGGGYTDIKANYNNWLILFEILNECHDKFAMGYSETRKEDIGYVRSFVDKKNAKKINKDLKNNYHIVIGNCSYIFKPRSLLAQLWYQELHLRLDDHFDDLKKNPGNIMGDNEGYPLPWTSILGQIFHPLCLLYNDKLIINDSLRPILTNYR